MLLDLISDNNSKEQIKSYYKSFNDVEKIIVDQGYLWNDEQYPSLYWKIIAGIYYLINRQHMPLIDKIYANSSLEVDSSRIRSSSEGEPFKICSIYDIYINFKIAYKPFKRDNIDIKLVKLGYQIEFLPSVKDKLILFIKDFATKNKLHPIEKELCENISFLLSINFMSFFESLLNFKYEPQEYIFESPYYDLLYYESSIFKEEIDKDINQKPDKVVYNILYKVYKNYYSRLIILLKKMLLGDFFIRIDDLLIALQFCRYFFTTEVSKKYITDILLIMKHRCISPIVVMLFDSSLNIQYCMLEPTTEYITKHTNKIDITMLPITLSNYIDVAGNCVSLEQFRSVIKHIKNKDFQDIKSCIKLFIVNMLKSGFINFGDLSDIDPQISDIVVDVKYDILSSYIRVSNFKLIKSSFDSITDWDLQNYKLIEATGESCNPKILEHIYGMGPYTDKFVSTIILSCYKKGSSIFDEYFFHPIFAHLSYNGNLLMKINDNDILNSIVESHNVTLLIKYSFAIDLNNANNLILKSIISNNLSMFSYLISNIKYEFINIESLVLTAAIYDRKIMLIVLLFETDKENNNTINKDNKFYFNILKQCVSIVSHEILNIFFNRMTYDYRDPKIQLFVLRRIFNKILRSKNKSWLEDNVSIIPIHQSKPNSKKTKISLYEYNSCYISSDDESDSDDELTMFRYLELKP